MIGKYVFQIFFNMCPVRNKFCFYIPQVSVDIFRGFPDEESIVNYTLNQAYQDNVSVFASKW